MNLNKAMIIGNVTRDPELRNTPSGQPVASFSVATNFSWVDQSGQKQDKAEFHNIVAWRKLAEICSQYLKKGSKVYVEGRLQTSEWAGQDGNKRYRTEIILENMIMLDSKGQGGSSYNNQSNKNEDVPVIQQDEADDDEEIKVENIPF
ncbi:MAG: single-stranded DNA-binding protein [Candidatus Pacebacteria bacterium]|nr:single-stranded DNA-binding protein [Candidatus Paceibacterota bacterium]